MPSLSVPGRWCFGVALIGSGMVQLASREFVRLVPKFPAWVPAPGAWPLIVGALLLVIGFALLANRQVDAAANLLVALLAISFAVQRVPEIVANPGAGYVWTNPAKVLALLGGALLLARPGPASATLAAWLLAAFLLLGGVQHFVYAGFVDTLVPAWVPPDRRFWTLFAGMALVAGGLGVLLPRTRRIAGLWTGVMIFLWVPLVHLARAFELRTAFELAGVFEALALAGGAWLVAGAAGAPRGND